MQTHELQSDYNYRTGLFIKNVFVYANKLPSTISSNVLKDFITFGLNTYLHNQKVGISQAFSLSDCVSAMLKEENVNFNRNELVHMVELFNSIKDSDSYMFYPDLQNKRDLINHALIHYMYFNDLAETNFEHNKDSLFASQMHYDMAKNAIEATEDKEYSEIMKSFIKEL